MYRVSVRGVTDLYRTSRTFDTDLGPVAIFRKLLIYFVLRPTQPLTLSGTGNEYQPIGADVLRLWSKSRYGSCLVSGINCVIPCKTRVISERFKDVYN